MSNETVEKSSNLIIGIIFVAILLSVLLLALVLIMGAVNTAGSNLAGGGITSTGTITNETLSWINGTGDTFNILVTIPTATNCAVTSAYNASSGLLIAPGNYTVNTGACTWTNTTSRIWNNASVSYTYQVYTSSTSNLNSSTTSIQNGVLGLIINFFALAPTIGTIFAVVILIAGIVLLVIYVRKMKDKDTEGAGFSG